jgi:hypothetical protein
MIMPIMHPEMMPETGRVMIHLLTVSVSDKSIIKSIHNVDASREVNRWAYPKYIQATILQLIDRQVPLQRPTPTVAPQIHCVVEIGSARRVAIITVTAEPSSMEKPRLGE